MVAPLTIEYWADYLCPWCYLAQDRVRYLQREHGAKTAWRAFELHPEIPPEGALHRTCGATAAPPAGCGTNSRPPTCR